MLTTNVATLLAAGLFAAQASAQWAPSCSYNDCMQGWDASGCSASSGWDCVCGNATAIAQINTCVATSCTNTTDQEAIYGAIAQLCANNGVTVTNAAEATFSATSGGSLFPTITGHAGWGPGGNWNSGAWSSWVSACSTAIGSAPSGWNGNGAWGGGWQGGPGGASGWSGWSNGPWGTKASGVACNGAWTTWTAGWGPFSSWTGTWSGCSTTTATPKPATVTTTVTSNGQVSVVTGTTFGVQAAAASASTGTSGASSHSAWLSNSNVMNLCAGVVVAVFAMMIAL